MTDQPVSYFPVDDPAARCLPARPEPIMMRPAETALIIVDMQNAYASPGGYLDLAGFDISGAARAIAKIKQAADAARAAGMPVIFFQNGWDRRLCRGRRPRLAQLAQVERAEDHARAGPNCRASCWPRAAGTTSWCRRCRRSPATSSSPKPRYSAFFNTNLDSLLRARGIRSLVFTGIATNVCVESTLRDGFFLEYFGVVLHDATHHAGPDFIQQASLYNVEKFFGWVSSVDEFRAALQANTTTSDSDKPRGDT